MNSLIWGFHTYYMLKCILICKNSIKLSLYDKIPSDILNNSLKM